MRKNFFAISLITCIFNVTLVNQAKAEPTPVTLYAAGSLTDALSEVATNFTQVYGIPVNTVFGPSGLLRQRLENGEQADVFASADLGNPLTLSQENLSGAVVTFTSNSLSAVARPGLSLTPDNLLDQLLNPDVKLGTSTPVSDPLGDYTQEVFRKADQIKPGSFQVLDAKALRLVGGPNSQPVPAGRNSLVYFIQDTHQADIFLAYYTSALSAVKQSPTLQAVRLPDNLAVEADYGLTVLKNASPEGEKLEQYILSPEGQNILAKYGFNSSPTGVPEPEDVGEIALAFGVALLFKKKLASSKKRQLISSQSPSLEELSILHPESTRQTIKAEVSRQSVKG